MRDGLVGASLAGREVRQLSRHTPFAWVALAEAPGTQDVLLFSKVWELRREAWDSS